MIYGELFTILVSMETLASDVQHLRKGLDAAKSERDKQPDNYAIHVSFPKYDFFYAVVLTSSFIISVHSWNCHAYMTQ